MLEEIDILSKANKIRKPSIRSEKEEEEHICNICYYFDKDTACEPCGHTTCAKCIQTHMLNK